MRKTMAGLLCAALMLPAAPALAKVARLVEPLAKHKTVVVKSDGAEVRLVPGRKTITEGEGADREEVEVDTLAITATVPGFAPLAVPAQEQRSDSYGIWLAIGKLAKTDVAPSVILEGYSGGLHCCSTFQLVTPVDGALKVLTLPGIDGGPDVRFPKDLDGDGTAEFLRADDSFRYQFTDGAGSWSPPVVYALRGGELVDVSAESRFAPVWRKFAADALKTCRDQTNEGRNGACSVYAAAQARLGQAEEGIATAVHYGVKDHNYFLPEGCKVVHSDDDPCPEGQEITFDAFEPALRWFLNEEGYTD